MNEIERVFLCKSCDFAVETDDVAEYETEPEMRTNQTVIEGWEIDTYHFLYKLTKCPRCESPFLHRYEYFNHHEAGSYLQEIDQLYPSEGNDLLKVESIPAQIGGIYQQAKKCFDSGLYEPTVIMCRKCLEAICKQLGAKGSNLNKKLNDLHEKGTIDHKLFSWSTQLRLVGNDAAHDLEVKLSKTDAKDSLTFLNALLMYIFTLDKKFASFQSRTKKN